MGQFGEKLRRERELRGITLEEVAMATKIGTRNLRALEEEKFSQLPGGIFNKGFVRAYARYVGIDEDQAVGDYVAANQDAASSGEVNIAVVARQFDTYTRVRIWCPQAWRGYPGLEFGDCFCPRQRLGWRLALSAEMVGAPGRGAKTNFAANQYSRFAVIASSAGAGRLEFASASIGIRQYCTARQR